MLLVLIGCAPAGIPLGRWHNPRQAGTADGQPSICQCRCSLGPRSAGQPVQVVRAHLAKLVIGISTPPMPSHVHLPSMAGAFGARLIACRIFLGPTGPMHQPGAALGLWRLRFCRSGGGGGLGQGQGNPVEKSRRLACCFVANPVISGGTSGPPQNAYWRPAVRILAVAGAQGWIMIVRAARWGYWDCSMLSCTPSCFHAIWAAGCYMCYVLFAYRPDCSPRLGRR